MCNRCGCRRGFDEFDRCDRDRECGWDRCNRFGHCGQCGDEAWFEAERIAREANRRRCREDRCAREFTRCMRCTRREF